MNTLVKKEIRLLLPVWLAAMALAVVSAWHCRPDNPGRFILPLYGMALLAVGSFGREFSIGTFGMLLAQPISRRVLWRAKLAVLAGALGLVAAVCLLCGGVKFFSGASVPALAAVPVAAALAVGGGFCFTLLTRQTTPAIVFTLLVPTAIVILASFILERFNVVGHTAFGILALALTVGAALGIYWSLSLFTSIEETPAAATAIGLFFRPSRETATAARPAPRIHLPLVALMRKEFGLQSFSLYGMAALFVSHLAVLALRAAFLRSNSVHANDLDVFLTSFGLLWFLPPFFVAATSIAEERRLGAMDVQRCLPFSAGRQYLLKFCFVLLCGGALSASLFDLAETLGAAWGVKHNIIHSILTVFGNSHREDLAGFSGYIDAITVNQADHTGAETFAGMLVLFLFVTGIAFYASTLTGYTLEALAVGVVFFALAVAGYSYRFAKPTFTAFSWGIQSLPLGIYCALLALVLVIPWLGWLNVRDRQSRLRRLATNLSGLAGSLALAAVLTLLVYFRTWEWVLPSAAHGTPRLSLQQSPPQLRSTSLPGRGMLYSLLFADGRLWAARGALHYEDGRFAASRLAPGQFLAGNDWTDVALAEHTIIGIRSDGTLWSAEYTNPRANDLSVTENAEPIVMQRVSADTHWKNVIALGWFALLLRDDGSLWHWGPADENAAVRYTYPSVPEDFSNHPVPSQYLESLWPGLAAFPLIRLETASKWTALNRNKYPIATDAEGRAWLITAKNLTPIVKGSKSVPYSPSNPWDHTEAWPPNLQVWRLAAPAPTTPYVQSTGWIGRPNAQIAIRQDGTLWALRTEGDHQVPTNKSDAIEISKDTDWRLAETLIWPYALKKDHTVWVYRPSDPMNDFRDLTTYGQKPKQEGGWKKMEPHADWVAIYTANGRIGLAADGGLWQWDLQAREQKIADWLLPITLAPSRRPALLGNIFTSRSDQKSPSASDHASSPIPDLPVGNIVDYGSHTARENIQ